VIAFFSAAWWTGASLCHNQSLFPSAQRTPPHSRVVLIAVVSDVALSWGKRPLIA
jgi:hypothetical protein